MEIYSEQVEDENHIDDLVNWLNSARHGSSNPVKVSNNVNKLRVAVRQIRLDFPSSEFGELRNVTFGADVVEHFQLHDLL